MLKVSFCATEAALYGFGSGIHAHSERIASPGKEEAILDIGEYPRGSRSHARIGTRILQ